MSRVRSLAAVAALAGLLTTAGACDRPSAGGAAPGTGPSAPAAATGPAEHADYRGALAELGQLRVAPEDTGAHYSRDDWKHWTRAGGCTTRELIIKRDALATAKGKPIQYDKCHATGNAYWVSRYDNVTITDVRTLEVDHWVPLKQLAVSGTRGWTASQREQYANDPEVLIAVSERSNAQKSSQDPAKWSVPDSPAFGCEYQAKWVWVKAKYSRLFGQPVTVDPAEKAALHQKLTLCAKGAV
ncbi:GmrSD restriction endonuclease domain-containing protein [Amycolatopsis minnesotensis]|uniref:GmrSD restriction endonucleases C-terminal domain-containing protein n=1 Tax=Amycolatopsis minnesotensis TaxID=337894 RepID=A0ABN2SA62_9PSEU